MAFLLAKTTNHALVKEYIEETRERLRKGSPIGNVLSGNIATFQKHKYLYVYGYIEPIFPKFYYIGILGLIAVWVFTGKLLTPWNIAPAIIGACGFFWSSTFIYFIFKLGLKKKGYIGLSKRLTKGGVLKSLI